MLKIEEIEVVGFRHAIRGMRNPKNSWDKSDSCTQGEIWCNEFCNDHFAAEPDYKCGFDTGLRLGPNDFDLMSQLSSAGTDHRKFMRMIVVYLDITAPLYWWKEFDTYKVGTVANSCSTMHMIHSKEFTLDDFSHEHLFEDHRFYTDSKTPSIFGATQQFNTSSMGVLKIVIETLNLYREKYLETKDKRYWWQMIQLLPSSYNQKRTIMLSYEVLANIYRSRVKIPHKLDEWRQFGTMIEELPYSELITQKVDANGE